MLLTWGRALAITLIRWINIMAARTLQITLQHPRDKIWPVTATLDSEDGLPFRQEGELDLGDDWPAELLALDINADQYGEYLGRALFQNGIYDITRDATKSSEAVHVFLNVEANELKPLRWERLSYKNGLGQWVSLAQDQQLVYSHYFPSLIDRKYPVLSKHNLRILALISSPTTAQKGYQPFDTTQAKAALEQANSDIPVTYLADSGDSSWDSLLVELNRTHYAILHIVAHGFYNSSNKKNALIIPYQKNAVINADDLISELSRIRNPPNLIFLSSCETAIPDASQGTRSHLARRLLEEVGTPAVIAMSDTVSIQTAHTITQHFYEHLQQDAHVDIALAKAGVALLNAPDRHMPVLYHRLGSRPLFTTEGKPVHQLNSDELLLGCERLGGEDGQSGYLEERAPILIQEYKGLVKQLDFKKLAEAQLGVLDGLDKLSQEACGIGFAALAQGEVVEGYDARCPFPGMRPFKQSDNEDPIDYREFFFGRDVMVGELLTKLDQLDILMIKGASGSGKSSIVYAGLLPKLKERHRQNNQTLQVAILRPASPRQADGSFIKPLFNLQAAIDPLDLQQPAVIFVDQFEELFTTCRTETPVDKLAMQQSFLNALLALPKQNKTWKIILTMRADFTGDCAPYPDLRKIVQDQAILLPSMTQEELRKSISAQTESVELVLEQGLLHSILKGVENQPGAMPLLQYLLWLLWTRRRGRYLRHEEYRIINAEGNNAITRIADSHFRQYDKQPEMQSYLQNIYLRLVRPDSNRMGAANSNQYRDTRQRVNRQELYPKDADRKKVHQLIQELADSKRRLIVTTESDVEISHESLIQHWPLLECWLSDGLINKVRQDIRESAQAWKGEINIHRKKSQLAHTGTRLEDIKQYKQGSLLFPTEEEEAYLKACQTEDENKVRNQLYVCILAVFFAAMFSISGIISWLAIDQKNKISDLDAGRYLRTGSELSKDGLWQKASLFFAKAQDASTTEVTKNLIHNALTEIGPPGFQLTKILDEPTSGIIQFDDSSKLLVWNGNLVQVWDADMQKKLGKTIHSFGSLFTDVMPIADGKRVLTADEGGKVQVWEIATGEKFGKTMKHSAEGYTPTLKEPDGPGAIFKGGFVFDNEQSFLSWDYDGYLYLYDLSTGNLVNKTQDIAKLKNTMRFFENETRLLVTGWDVYPSGAVPGWEDAYLIEIPSLKTLRFIDYTSYESVILSQSGKCFVTGGGEDEKKRLWSSASGENIIVHRDIENKLEDAIFNFPECSSDLIKKTYYPEVDSIENFSTEVKKLDSDYRRIVAGDSYHKKFIIKKDLIVTTNAKTQIWDIVSPRNELTIVYNSKKMPDISKTSLAVRDVQVFDNKLFLVSYSDGSINVYERHSFSIYGKTLNHGPDILGAYLFSDGKRVMSWGVDSVRLWDVLTGKEIGTSRPHSGETGIPLILHNEEYFLTWNIDENHALVWDVVTGKSLNRKFPHNGSLSLIISSDKQRFLTLNRGIAQFWSTTDFTKIGKEIKLIEKPTTWQDIESSKLQILGNTPKLLYDSANTEQLGIQIYDAFLGKVGPVISYDPEDSIEIWLHEFRFVAALSESGDYIFIRSSSSDAGATLQIRAIETGELILAKSLEYDGYVPDFFSKNKTLLIEQGRKPISEWNIKDLDKFISYSGNSDDTSQVIEAFYTKLKNDHPILKADSRGAMIYSAGEKILTRGEKSIRIWDAKSSLLLDYPMKHQEEVLGVKMFPDEKSILTWTKSTMYLWAIDTKKTYTYLLNEIKQVLKVGYYINETGQSIPLTPKQLERCNSAVESYESCSTENSLWCKGIQWKRSKQKFFGWLPTIKSCMRSDTK